MLHPTISAFQVTIVKTDECIESRDSLAVEEPLEVQIEFGEKTNRRLKTISVTMRTPGNDTELAIGFLFTEGIIRKPADVLKVEQIDANVVRVYLHEIVEPDLQKLERHFYTSSSCGVCGKSSIDAVRTVTGKNNSSNSGLRVSSSVITRLPQLLRQQQDIFRHTGGLHASALFGFLGELILIREDVGRHNALDKLIGAAMQENILPLNQHVLLLSGRASFELIQKAIMAGMNVVAAVGAPSSLAVQMASEHHLTLIGFLRDGRFNIYAGKERIITNPARTESL